ncbi:MAG: hypothetical protein A3E01_04600 [Gammaproteobacteria bacterium RIFCSPHIGHO2_12_FULL_63_22]|nr:MAG: hypothetical protein A3E01_04600 [Gammaproteobacteria bacterium RIFCSPHIGHO2_12_FULL_63_22]
MSRVEVIGNATLYWGDCREILPTLPKVDAVITDPPYEAEAHTAMRRTNKSIRSGENDVIDFDAMDETTRQTIALETVRLCHGWALLFCQVEATSSWRDAMVLAGAKYRRSMAWVKPDSSPQFNGQGPAQGYECISASWCGGGKSRWNAGGKRGVYEFNCNHGRYGGHPTEKPVPLMEALVADFTDAGAVILDPFMGSGTTGVASHRLQRAFIGIERDPRYFDLACRRIEDAQRQERMFA